ncbi:MAG TPA: universal stress protein [Flavobacteriales bacterium]|jgi:nucleotide-binding universal stress UspA family protein|nr:universal stress protein [Flavobacteriales bacterium]
MPYRRILIAVDNSAYSEHAVARGFELASALKAEVALVFVVDLRKGLGDIDANILPQEAVAALTREGEDTLRKFAALRTDGPVEVFMPDGIPSEGILQVAETWQADLVVTGTHGRTGLAHFFAGSVAEHVVRHASMPVMVVPMHP